MPLRFPKLRFGLIGLSGFVACCALLLFAWTSWQEYREIRGLITSLSKTKPSKPRIGRPIRPLAATSSVPVIVARKSNPGTSLRRTMEALVKKGPSAVPILVKTLQDKRTGNYTKVHVARVLSRLTNESNAEVSKVAISSLVQALKAQDPVVRTTAALALGEFGQEAKVAVSELIEALKENNPYAAHALGRIGPDARDAIPALITALHGPTSGNAAHALKKIDPTNEISVPAAIEEFKKTFENGDVQARLRITAALGYLGPAAKAATPVLIEAIRNESRYVLQETHPLRPILRSNPVRKKLAETLKKIDPVAAAQIGVSSGPDPI